MSLLYDAYKQLKAHHEAKRELEKSPTDISDGFVSYKVMRSVFGLGGAISYHRDKEKCFIRVCYKGKFDDSDVPYGLHVNNGRLVKEVDWDGCRFYASMDIEWAARFVMRRKTDINPIDLCTIFNAYAQILLQRVLQVNPKYKYSKREWRFHNATEEELNIKMTQMIANYIKLTTKGRTNNGRDKTRGTRKHKESAGIHL